MRAPVVDAHLHLADPELPGSKPFPAWFGDPERVARAVAAQLDAAGADWGLALGSLAISEADPLGLTASREAAARLPGRVRLAGTADPRRGRDRAHLARVETALAAGEAVALKAYLGYLHTSPDDPAYAPYWELAAAFGVPVVLHTGDTYATAAKLEHAHPLRVDAAAADHPDTRFVMAHLGCPWLLDAAEVLYKNPNVWADLSGWLVGAELGDVAARGWFERQLHDAMAYAAGWERLLFGSDWPLVAVAGYREAIAAMVPPEHHAAVFGGTAVELFGG